jgi:hypothetical protein
LVRILGVFVFKHSKEAAIIQLYQKEAQYVASDKEEKAVIDGPDEGMGDFLAQMFIKDPDFIQKFGHVEYQQLGPRIGGGIVPHGFEEYYGRFTCQFFASQKSFYRNVQIRSGEMPCGDVRWMQSEILRVGTALSKIAK